MDSYVTVSANANQEATTSHVTPVTRSDNRDNEVLAAIHSLRADVTTRHDEVLSAIQGIKKDLSEYSGRLDVAENRISTAEDAVTEMGVKLDITQKLLDSLTSKCLDLESRSRRSNMVIVGLKESTEGKDVEMFLEKWIPDLIGDPGVFSSPLPVERGHRLGKPRMSGDKPRPLIMKFLNYRDKMKVMNTARAKGKLMHGNQQILFFHDHPQAIQEKRKKYDSVKRDLRAHGIEDFGIIHPARFRLDHGGRRHVFESPAEVETFMKNLRNVERRQQEEEGEQD